MASLSSPSSSLTTAAARRRILLKALMPAEVVVARQPAAGHICGSGDLPGLADGLARAKLLAREIKLDSAGDPIPVVHPVRRAVSGVDIGDQQLPPEQVLHDEGR